MTSSSVTSEVFKKMMENAKRDDNFKDKFAITVSCTDATRCKKKKEGEYES